MTTTKSEDARAVQDYWRLSDACIVGALLLSVVIVGVLLEFTVFRNSIWILTLTRFQANQAFALWVSALQLILGGFAVSWIAKIRSLGTPLASVGWNFTNNVAQWSLIGFALAAFVTYFLFAAKGNQRYELFPATIILYLLSTVLAMPFIEECYFRGILFDALDIRIGTVGAVVSTSLLFALIHPAHQITVLPAAIVFGIARARSRSVAACFILHAAYNLGVFFFPLLYGRMRA